MNTLIKTLRIVGATASIAISLTAFSAHAIEATAEQRRACTPDAFRLCSAAMPNVDKIIACMKANASKLSPQCKVVFDQLAGDTKVAEKQD